MCWRCMFSIWLLVTRHCQNQLCGIFHHIDSENNYATPSLFLKASGGLIVQIPATLEIKRSHRICPMCAGQLHIQMKGEYGESAFISAFQVPLSQWCQISVMIEGARVRGHKFTRGLAYLQVVNKAVNVTLSQTTVSMLCVAEEQRTFHSMAHT